MQYYGGIVEDVLEVIVFKVNCLNQVLEWDVFICLEFIENNDLIIFIDFVIDNFFNGNILELLSQVGIVINFNIGLFNYDIGYVFNVYNDFVGNGVVFLSFVCNINKVNGVFGIILLEGDLFVIDIIVYEVGY